TRQARKPYLAFESVIGATQYLLSNLLNRRQIQIELAGELCRQITLTRRAKDLCPGCALFNSSWLIDFKRNGQRCDLWQDIARVDKCEAARARQKVRQYRQLTVISVPVKGIKV